MNTVEEDLSTSDRNGTPQTIKLLSKYFFAATLGAREKYIAKSFIGEE